jgi:hypothetical protein
MISETEFVTRAENELRTTKSLSLELCVAATASEQLRQTYGPAMAFLGCGAPEPITNPSVTVPQASRVGVSRLMLISLGLDRSDPIWSSSRLTKLIETDLSLPGGGVGDVFLAVYDLLGEFQQQLTPILANFIKQLVIECFTQYRVSYSGFAWGQFAQQVTQTATRAQCYLAMLGVPPSMMPPHKAIAILRALVPTEYGREAMATLADDLRTDVGQRLLREWLNEEGSPLSAHDAEQLLQPRGEHPA